MQFTVRRCLRGSACAPNSHADCECPYTYTSQARIVSKSCMGLNLHFFKCLCNLKLIQEEWALHGSIINATYMIFTIEMCFLLLIEILHLFVAASLEHVFCSNLLGARRQHTASPVITAWD